MDLRKELVLDSDTAHLATVRQAAVEVARQVGFEGQALYAIELCITEAVANVIEHGYEGRSGERIQVVIAGDDTGIRMATRDWAPPVPDGMWEAVRAPDPLAEGGRGLFLMKSLMDAVIYRRVGDRNELLLVKWAAPPVPRH